MTDAPSRRSAATALQPLEPRTLFTTYVVDTLSDTNAADGLLSLREAVEAANTNAMVNEAAAGVGFTRDVITFDPSLTGGTIELNSTLTISEDIQMRAYGRDITLDANDNGRVFNINAGTNAIIKHVTITGGTTSSTGGAIYNSGSLRLRSVTVRDNDTDALVPGVGAGIGNIGALTVINTDFIDNEADNAAAIYSTNGAVRILRSTFTGNTATSDSSGAVQVSGGSLVIKGSTFTNNTAAISGGAMSVYSTVPLTMQNTTFDSNSALRAGAAYLANQNSTLRGVRFVNNSATATTNDAGGAIRSTAGMLTIQWSEFEGNQTNGGGGGIATRALTDGTIVGTTFTNNADNKGGGAIYVDSDDPFDTPAQLLLRNLTFDGNTSAVTTDDFTADPGGSSSNGYGGAVHLTGATLDVTGHNLSFVSNSAYRRGGAIWNDTQSFTLTQSTFSSNTIVSVAGSGASLYSETDFDLDASTLESADEDLIDGPGLLTLL